MDFHALQQKLFELDPTDPREDLAKLKAQAQGNAPTAAKETVDYLNESASVTEGSLRLDRDYSVDDFAALAGVVNEKRQRPADQVRGSEPMPKAKPSRTEHPYQDRLVGDSIDYDDQELDELDIIQRPGSNSQTQQPSPQTIQQIGQRIQQTEQRLQKIEELLKRLQAALSQTGQAVQERELTRGEEREKERIVKGMKKNKSDFEDRYGDDAEAVMYATATKNAKNESVDSIKESLYAALNKKMNAR